MWCLEIGAAESRHAYEGGRSKGLGSADQPLPVQISQHFRDRLAFPFFPAIATEVVAVSGLGKYVGD